MSYFVTAIDTDSGKTLVSAILCTALQADYWKPIQAGLPKDSDWIRTYSEYVTIYPERYLLKTPASPHAAAKIDGIEISVSDFSLPSKHVIVEGAGGCMVPINDREFMIDLISKFGLEVMLVADLYLGSINHTLLTIEALQLRKIKMRGVIFNGDSNPESERIILLHSGLEKLLHIKREKEITKDVVAGYAATLKAKLDEK